MPFQPPPAVSMDYYNAANNLANVETIKNARTNNALGQQQILSNDQIAQFRDALSSGNMQLANQIDPQAFAEFQSQQYGLQGQQQALRTAEDAETKRKMKLIRGTTDKLFNPDGSRLATDAEMDQYIRMAIVSLEAQGVTVDVDENTPREEIWERLENVRQITDAYEDPKEPQKWTGGQAAMDPSGNPVFMQTDQYGNARPVQGGYAPMPSKTFQTVVDSDGNITTSYGTGVGGTGGLEKTVRKGLQETIINTTESLDYMNDQLRDYDENYLTFGGDVKGKVLWFKAKVEGSEGLDPQERRWYTNYNNWRTNSYAYMNEEIKRITGAQMSELEANRLRKQMPDPEKDDPLQFYDKSILIRDKLYLVQARAYHYLSEGLTPPANKNQQWAVSITQMKRIIADRAEKLAKLYEAEGMSRTDAATAASDAIASEYGIN